MSISKPDAGSGMAGVGDDPARWDDSARWVIEPAPKDDAPRLSRQIV